MEFTNSIQGMHRHTFCIMDSQNIEIPQNNVTKPISFDTILYHTCELIATLVQRYPPLKNFGWIKFLTLGFPSQLHTYLHNCTNTFSLNIQLLNITFKSNNHTKFE